ncbi:MAG: RHS repeat domain-containing protein [Spirulina sp.]
MEVKDAENRITKYEYDKAGRRTAIALPQEAGETQEK